MERLEDIIQNLGQLIEIREDEYERNGVLYCRKCNTPRTVTLNTLGRVRCRCVCEIEAYQREEKQRRLELRQETIERIRKSSLIGKRYKNVTFATTETGHNPSFDKAYIRCQRFCNAADRVLADGLGIYLFGATGAGKTHLTACMANEMISNYRQVLLTNFAEIGKAIKATYSRDGGDEGEVIERFAYVDFLFVDDLGTERVKDKDGADMWLQEKVYDVLNKRYNLKKPTVFTSNYSLDQLVTERGMMSKTVDRIAEMSNAILEIKGGSYRMKARQTDLPF